MTPVCIGSDAQMGLKFVGVYACFNLEKSGKQSESFMLGVLIERTRFFMSCGISPVTIIFFTARMSTLERAIPPVFSQVFLQQPVVCHSFPTFVTFIRLGVGPHVML